MSGNGTEEEDRCAGYLDLEYDATATVVCGINLFFGVVYCLFGYRCFKAVMFVTGFVSASAIVYAVCLEEDLLPEYGNEAAALGTGFLFGLVAMLVHHVGLFVTGLHTGLLAGVAVLAILDTWSHIGTVWVSVGVLLGCALIGAVLTLTLQKSLTIAGTSLHGGAVVAAALDYYVEKCRMALWLWDKVKVAPDGGHNPCWFSWLLLSVWPALFIVGTATQSLITGRYYYHTYQRKPPILIISFIIDRSCFTFFPQQAEGHEEFQPELLPCHQQDAVILRKLPGPAQDLVAIVTCTRCAQLTGTSSVR